MATLDDVKAAADSLVATVRDKAIPLLNQLASGGTVNPQAAQAVVDELTGAHNDLEAAVATDTPPSA